MPSPKLPHAADYETLGRALRGLREAAGLTQVQAAERSGIRSKFVSEVERGNRGLRWHTLLALLDAYNCRLRDLADAVETGSSPPRRPVNARRSSAAPSAR
jgi:transcriptional regulator with XRE-family HTH domain